MIKKKLFRYIFISVVIGIFIIGIIQQGNIPSVDFKDYNENNEHTKSGIENNISQENIDKINYQDIRSMDGDLFISNDDIVDISDASYSNIYIFDQAQVTLTNVTVTGDIEIYGEATLLMQNEGSFNRLFLNEFSTVTLNAISHGDSITGNDNSTLIISHVHSIGWNDHNFYDGASVQVSDSSFYDNINFNDYSTFTFFNVSFGYLTLYEWSSGNLEYSRGDGLNLYSRRTFNIHDVTVYNCHVSSPIPQNLQNMIIINTLSIYSSATLSIFNSSCKDLYVSSDDMSYSESSLYAENLLVNGSSRFIENVSVVLNSCNLQGSTYIYRVNWQTAAPKVTFQSTDATITKEPSGSNSYNNTADELKIVGSSVTLIFMHVKILELSSYSSVTLIVSSYDVYNNIDGTGNIQEGGTQLINGNYFIGGADIISLESQVYSNIYIFDQAQVTLTNVTVTGDIEIYGEATLLMQNEGSFNRLFLNEFSTLPSMRFHMETVLPVMTTAL
ncbi:MAG: hypothetical protein K9W44_14525 [Candidatus Lokiarchaeota archaeon]|nr:hypothetical protein [Candidatus Harpocratesius repetitus]